MITTSRPPPSPPRSEGKSNAVDPASGFVYERVPYVSAASLAYDHPPSHTLLVDKPHKKKGVRRIASPFTVESLSPYRSLSPEEYASALTDTSSQEGILEALRVSGSPLKSGEKLKGFDNFEPLGDEGAGFLTHRCDVLYPKGSAKDDQAHLTSAVLSILPEDASCSASWINRASHVAATDQTVNCLLIIAFHFESDAFQQHSKRGRLNVHCLRANRDLMIDSLQFTESDQAFIEIGEPDVLLIKRGRQLVAKIRGYDTFNPKTGNLSEGGKNDIQCWMIDTNYDQKQFFARRFHFPGRGGDKQIKRFQRSMKKHIDSDEWKAMLGSKSTPFPIPTTGLIAVRIITNTGVEMTTVLESKDAVSTNSEGAKGSS